MLIDFSSSFQAAIRLARGGPSPLTCPPCLQATTSNWLSFASACLLSPSPPEPQWTSTTPTGTTAPTCTAQRTGCSWAAWELIPVRWSPRPPGGCSTWQRCSGAGCSGSTPLWGRRSLRWRRRRKSRSGMESSTTQLTGSWWWSSRGRTQAASECQHSSAQLSTPSTSVWTGTARGPAGPRGTTRPSRRDGERSELLLQAVPQRRRRVLSAGRWTCGSTLTRSAGVSGLSIPNGTTPTAVRGTVPHQWMRPSLHLTMHSCR